MTNGTPIHITVGDLIVGEQFRLGPGASGVYVVKRIDRDGHQWPSPRHFYIGPPGKDGKECHLDHMQLVFPVQKVEIRNGVVMLGERVLEGQ